MAPEKCPKKKNQTFVPITGIEIHIEKSNTRLKHSVHVSPWCTVHTSVYVPSEISGNTRTYIRATSYLSLTFKQHRQVFVFIIKTESICV